MRLVSHGQGLHRESLGKVGVESVGEVGRSRGDEHVVDVPVLRHELVGLDATKTRRQKHGFVSDEVRPQPCGTGP